MVVAPLVFCGIEAGLFPDRHITLSQQGFYRQIPELQLIHFAKDNKMALPERVLQKRFKGYVGFCLWLLNTGFDLVLMVTQYACVLLDSLSNVSLLRLFVSLSKKLFTRVQNRIQLSFFLLAQAIQMVVILKLSPSAMIHLEPCEISDQLSYS